MNSNEIKTILITNIQIIAETLKKTPKEVQFAIDTMQYNDNSSDDNSNKLKQRILLQFLLNLQVEPNVATLSFLHALIKTTVDEDQNSI